MGFTDSVLGTPGQTQIHQTPATRDPGYGFAKKFFNSMGGAMQNPYPTYQGNLDPGMSPTMQDAIRRAQGFAQSGPSEILQAAQGSLGRFMSPNFQNPWNSLFGGAANYGGADPNQRIYGGQPAGAMAFQNGMPQPDAGNQIGRMAKNMTTGESGGMVNGQWTPNGGAPSPGSGITDAMMQAIGQQGGQSSGAPPQPGLAAGMAPQISSALGLGQREPNDAGFSGGNQSYRPPDGSSLPWDPASMSDPRLPPGMMLPTSGAPAQPQATATAPWGSGQNAQTGFRNFMSTIDKQYRQGTPGQYINEMLQKNPTVDQRPPQGGAATDWRAYWKSMGRPGALGSKPGGGQPTRRGGPTDQGVMKPMPSGPRDQGVAKPMPKRPKKKVRPYELLTALG